METSDTANAWTCLVAIDQAGLAANHDKARRRMPSTDRARKLAILVCALVILLPGFAVLQRPLFSSAKPAGEMGADAQSEPSPFYVIEVAYPFWRRTLVPPQDIPFDLINEISHVFVLPEANGSLNVPDGFLIPELIQTAHAARRKVNLGVGGANCYDEFATMAANSQYRAAFIHELTGFAIQNGYDGVEIDWEFPQNSADRLNLTAFITELSSSLHQQGHDAIQLTLVVSKNSWYGQWIDVEMMSPFVDYFLVMAFKYHGLLSPYSGHNTPMYPPAIEPDSMSVDGGIAYWVETRGIPPAKVLLGLATFGVSFDSENLYAPFNQSDQSDYVTIQSLIGRGYSRSWDSVSLVPYLTQDEGPWLWSYDDAESIGIKCDFAIQKSLRGVAIWDIAGDLNDHRHELLAAAAQRFARSYLFLPLIYRSP